MKKKLKVDQEAKRQLVLDLAEVIANSGENGIQMSELVKEVKSEFDDRYVSGVVKRDLVNCLGKNNIIRGERRWARYVIDDLSIAVNLINDHFDRKKNDLQLWELYADIADYINNTPAVTDKMVAEQFGVGVEFLDDLNSALLEYGTSLDFYKITSNGTKVKLNHNTLSVIQAKISELTPKVDKVKVEDAKKHIVPLPEDQRKMIQERLINVIYYLDLGETDVKVIAKAYENKFKEVIKYPTIHSLMAKIPGVRKYSDSYQVTDIYAAMEHVNPLRSMVRLEVALKNGTDVSTYKNMRFSRSLGEYDIYVLEDKNSYNIVIQVLNLMLMGASIDPIVVKKVRDLLDVNMSNGHKTLL